MAPPKRSNITCSACLHVLARADFKDYQLRLPHPRCVTCVATGPGKPPADTFLCSVCGGTLPRASFSDSQRRQSAPHCIACVTQSPARSRSGAARQQLTGLCIHCGAVLPWASFPAGQMHTSAPVCHSCTAAERCNHSCSFCGATLLHDEGSHFCCQSGRHVMDFSSYFTAPGDHLLQLFRTSSSQTDPSSFSALSRKYNSLFALAQHEIQSNTLQREIKLNLPHAPANIRIHGTMYRKVFSAGTASPLRYLIFDPKARDGVANAQGLERRVVKELEQHLLANNVYMTSLRRLGSLPTASLSPAVVLQWHEGVQEVAAIVDEDPHPTSKPRAVYFYLKNQSQPQYVHPLSPMYEPLSYPLWFPQGGRGWSPDVTSTCGQKVSQMWWYRQLLLRMPYMWACGRLLNDWLINMFCRMEDERFAALRRVQEQRVAKRRELCEVLNADIASSRGLGKTFYLPSSVPGSPRHLRKLRVDALELARRLGCPTWFITLTCNPYWPDIVAHLLPGQTYADRPDIVVRVFHARLEKTVAWIKQTLCKGTRYFVRVVEYQLRGLPHAHIVVAELSPPTSPAEVDLFISCALPKAEGPLRTLVLTHMVHGCTHGCHPNDPAQDCIKGCPWPFAEETTFDARGYPHHRRAPCDGHCPNCLAGRAAYGKHNVCLNRLIVEYNGALLEYWQGHANVKFAGSVELFEYLYKYLFKGPDKASYDVTMDETISDELREWQRGRYLCATEAVWRIFGYHTYDRTPHVWCLPVHLQNEDWIQFEEGKEDEAVSSRVSQLQRYFHRPREPEFLSLRYYEYFERFMVSATCPKSLRPWSDAISVVPSPAEPTHAVWLDDAPEGLKHFVYRRQKGVPPVCRLEMKYPRQKEVFFLRHLLLQFPQTSWASCKEYNGKKYKTHEETMLATGHFAKNDEAHAVLDELVALRYTGHQFRFAFVILLEQEPSPVTLFAKYEKTLLKDFLNRGRSRDRARDEVLRALHEAWLRNGNAEDTWKLELPQVAAQAATQSAGLAAASVQTVRTMLQQDADQWNVATTLLTLWKSGLPHFAFVEGRAGTGKSFVANYLHGAVTEGGNEILNVASTGIAALGMPLGATAHSVFGIPIDAEADLTSNISFRSQAAARIARAPVIQWDEFPSAKRGAWECVLKLLDALKHHLPEIYVPKLFVGYGDFRQIPPVVPRTSRQGIVEATVSASPSWHNFQCFRLTKVWRQALDKGFAQWLDKVGDGSLPTHTLPSGEKGYVSLTSMQMVANEDAMIDHCFPLLCETLECAQSKIMAVRNSMVDAYNNKILQRLVTTYRWPSFHKCSADTIDMDGENLIESAVTAEFLNMQNHPGVPPHSLHLVEGALYELVRNFSPKDRLMNHTPVVLKKVHAHHILVQTMTGQSFPIPRIVFRFPIANGTTTMSRRQYPLRPAYATSVHGVQGSTLILGGLDLRHMPFTHGQLYVALSRLPSRGSIRILADPSYVEHATTPVAKNIVWPELLLPQAVVATRCRKRPASCM